MEECPNAWVAEDPTQPGTAFAVCDADPQLATDANAEMADWKRRFNVDARLMNKADAKEWLIKWDRDKSMLKPLTN